VEWLAGKRTWFEAKSDSVLISGSAGEGTCQAVSYKWLKIASLYPGLLCLSGRLEGSISACGG
jgi:hypothetical protein